jgi:LysM repeat protein
MKERFYYIILFTIIAVYAWGIRPNPAAAAPMTAAPQSASEIIARINAYRAQNGLYNYTINQNLMHSAQTQSDYQASIQSVTHTGSGGTSPRDRAYAAGYGGGSTIWVSEIIYGGTQATVDTAMSWWKSSSVHNNAMLSSQSLEIGAGVASSGGSTYFTVVMGVVSGSASEETGGEISPPAIPNNPVQVAEPSEDGSLIHTIQAGQTLWTIAAVYDVPLDQLLELNEITKDTLLQPGQEIIIQPPRESEPTATPTVESTPTPSETKPIPTPSTTPQLSLTSSPSSENKPINARSTISSSQEASNKPGGGLSTIGIVAAGMIVMYAVIILVAATFRNVDDSQNRVE